MSVTHLPVELLSLPALHRAVGTIAVNAIVLFGI